MLPVKEGTLEVMNVICLKKVILIQSSRLVKTDNSLVLLPIKFFSILFPPTDIL